MKKMNSLKASIYSLEAARKIASQVKGKPTENRVLLAINDCEVKTSSGLYLPKEVIKVEAVKKGVIVGFGFISEGYKSWVNDLSIGSIVTYGEYAGKELELEESIELEGLKLTALSLNEIIFIEPNKY